MKKIFFLPFFTLFFMSACSTNLESIAKKQMEKTMNELAKDPSSIQISNVETVFSNDSICILHFKFSGKNGFGGFSSNNIEYIYLIRNRDGKKTRHESLIKLDEKESILNQAKKDYQEKKWENEYNKKLSDNNKKAWYIFFNADLYMLFNGREISSDKEEIDYW